MVGNQHRKGSGPPAPVTLIKGNEDALVQRALRETRTQLTRLAPEAEAESFSAATYESGELATYTSGSLFATEKILTVTDLEQMSDAFAQDFAAYITAPFDGIWIIALHGGGNRGQRVLRAIKAAQFPVITCETPKGDQAKIALVLEEVRDQGGNMDRDAAEALVAALGGELGELLASARQLTFDSGGHITREAVHTFHRGRVETKPYEVADALAEGNQTRALLLVRQAFATGVPPVVVVSALASKFRLLAKAKVPGLSPADVKAHPFQMDRARREAMRWSEPALGRAIRQIARADAAVKGESRAPEGAVELCIMEIARTR